MSNPTGRYDDSNLRTITKEAAKRSGQKAAETNERSRQILDYYRRGGSERAWKN